MRALFFGACSAVIVGCIVALAVGSIPGDDSLRARMLARESAVVIDILVEETNDFRSSLAGSLRAVQSFFGAALRRVDIRSSIPRDEVAEAFKQWTLTRQTNTWKSSAYSEPAVAVDSATPEVTGPAEFNVWLAGSLQAHATTGEHVDNSTGSNAQVDKRATVVGKFVHFPFGVTASSNDVVNGRNAKTHRCCDGCRGFAAAVSSNDLGVERLGSFHVGLSRLVA